MEQVSEIVARAAARVAERDRMPTASAILPEGGILEMVYDQAAKTTAFAVWKDNQLEIVPDVRFPDGRVLVPFSARNNLLEHGVVRFPSMPEEYGTERDLEADIVRFIRRYVGLSPEFERIASSYVLLSWLYDAFNELPYLRVRGEPGTGKTRFLLVVGSICYRPIFASGASTISPVFRILDAMRGTLILDESDFRFSDERAEVVKILNNGNVRGFPVLRTDTAPGSREFNPRAYHVYGPKIVATRGFFDDAALESRFLTEQMDAARIREDVPINLPKAYEPEALALRNRLLMYRFRNFGKERDLGQLADRTLEPRLSQIFTPLVAIAEKGEARRDLEELARKYDRELAADRLLDVEAEVLEIVSDLLEGSATEPSVKEIAEKFVERCGARYPQVTPKRIGWMLRRKLGLETRKTEGRYVLSRNQDEKLARMYERYGLEKARSAPAIQSP